MKEIIEPIPEDANNRICIEVFNADGILVQRGFGNSPEENQAAHDNGCCLWDCPICYEEGCNFLSIRSEER